MDRNYYLSSNTGTNYGLDIKEFLGKIFTSIVVPDDKENVTFISEDKTYVMYHEQDCCENVTLEDVCGDLSDLVGAPIIVAYEGSSQDCDVMGYDSYTWTFYHLATSKGWVTMRWFGESNGYYSESVDIKSYPTHQNS